MEIDLSKAQLDEWELGIAKGILKRDGTLYKSRPKNAPGETQYVWRMVAFFISPEARHQCIPASAEFYLPDQFWYGEKAWDQRRELVAKLTRIVDAIVDVVPVEQRHGVMAWGRAFG